MPQQESGISAVAAAVLGGGTAEQAELLGLLRAGDRNAFAELVDTWSPMLLRVALLHVSTRASAEEVVQDTWLAVIGQLDRFEGRSSLRTWVFRILENVARPEPWQPPPDDAAVAGELRRAPRGPAAPARGRTPRAAGPPADRGRAARRPRPQLGGGLRAAADHRREPA